MDYHNNHRQEKLKPNDTDIVKTTDEDEWTTSKKVVNHKTKQVETRVQRQIVMEDGKVIADSGPQITTRTNEDHRVEESEKGKKRKPELTGTKHQHPGLGYLAVPQSAEVVNEKTETRNTTREAKQECLQYHDESMKEMSGFEVHKKAITAPNELISIEEGIPDLPRGKLTHYSSKSKRITDKDEMNEISRRHRDGNVVTETNRTHHHEEVDGDEKPEKDLDLRALPEASTETKRTMEFVKDYDDDEEILSLPYYKLAVEAPFHEGRGSDTNSDEIVETSRTKAGGNVINIEMTSTRRPARPDRKTNSHETRGRTGGQKTAEKFMSERLDSYHSSPRRERSYLSDSSGGGGGGGGRRTPTIAAGHRNSPSPVGRETERSSRRQESSYKNYQREYRDTPSPSSYKPRVERTLSIEKEDASVQASFSENSSDEDIEKQTKYFASKRSDHRKENISSYDNNNNAPSRPIKTFFFGQDDRNSSKKPSKPLYSPVGKPKPVKEDIHRSYRHNESVAKTAKNYRSEDDYNARKIRECSKSPERADRGYMSADVHRRMYSKVGDVVDEKNDDESFHRSFRTPRERDDVRKEYDDFVSKELEKEPSYMSNRTIPVEYEFGGSRSTRKESNSRQRRTDRRYTPSPPRSPVPELIRHEDRLPRAQYKPSYKKDGGRGTSPAPSVDSAATFTKSRRISSTLGNKTDWPEFSPLTSPLEIRNIPGPAFTYTDTFDRNRDTNKTVNIEVKKWDQAY